MQIDDRNDIENRDTAEDMPQQSDDGQAQPGYGTGQSSSGNPEPPVRYNPQQQGQPVYYVQQGPNPNQGNLDEFNRIRRQVTIAQVCALVSLLIGGVLLSTAALIIAVLAQRKVNGKLISMSPDQPMWEALNKTAKVAIGMAVLALALNAISLVVMYPMMMEMLESSDYGSLFGSAGQGTSTGGTGTSTWG